MNNVLEYKGFTGSVEYSPEDGVLFGKVIGVRGLISYEGESVAELKADFEETVDSYVSACEEKGIEPQAPYCGSVSVRLAPELHRMAMIAAQSEHISLDKFIERSVEEKIRAVAGD